MVFLPLAVCLFSSVLSLVRKIREVFARMLKRYMPKVHYIIYFYMKQVQSVCGDIVYSICYSLCWSTTAFFITVTVTLYHATKYLTFYVLSWNNIPLSMANFPVVFISFFYILFCLLYDKWLTLLLVNKKKRHEMETKGITTDAGRTRTMCKIYWYECMPLNKV